MVRAARGLHHKPVRIGEADQELQIDTVGAQQFVHQRQHQRTVGSGSDADPFVGNGRVAGADRVDRYHPGAALLQFAQADLDRVGIMVLGNPEQQQAFCSLPVRLAELPERAADRVQSGRGDVDRAQPAMGSEVRCAELGGPPAGERLALVATGEEGRAARVGAADRCQPAGSDGQRLIPFDLYERRLAARPDPLERLAQPCRGEMVLQARGTLAAQHTVVLRMRGVPFDADRHTAMKMHVDAAATGAHVAGCLPHRLRAQVRRHIVLLPRMPVSPGAQDNTAHPRKNGRSQTEASGSAFNRQGLAVRHSAQSIIRFYGVDFPVPPPIAVYSACPDVDTLAAAVPRVPSGGARSG